MVALVSRYDLRDPVCHHKAQPLRVSSHADLLGVGPGEAMASVYSCEREVCVEDAKAWVKAVARVEPIVVRR